MHHYENFYIGGRWVAPQVAAEAIEVHDSTTEQIVGSVPQGSAKDVDLAVKAARDALRTWSASTTADRVEVLVAISAGLKARSEEIVDLISAEVGMPKAMALALQVGLPRATFADMASIVGSFDFETEMGNSLIVREPIGVVGAITPWNYPLHQIALKVAPAIAAGCTVVLKPSEVAPLNTFILAEVIHAAGLPAGVFNLVTGYGIPVGESIAAHEDVDMVSFTGSTGAGKRVAEVGSRTVKRVALELGGKSASIILDDADLGRAVKESLAVAFRNSGQSCNALSRMLVPRSDLAEVEDLIVRGVAAYAPGDPRVEGTRLGPLVSARQRESVRRYITQGLEEGARLLTGGADAPDDLAEGFFVRPTVFSDVRTDMVIAQEEIFGPVLAVIPYDSEDEAVDIANDSKYGLAGAVWSADQDRAERVARRIRTGQVDVNGARFNVSAPFGGYKQSGLGREAGLFGFEEFLETKAIQR